MRGRERPAGRWPLHGKPGLPLPYESFVVLSCMICRGIDGPKNHRSRRLRKRHLVHRSTDGSRIPSHSSATAFEALGCRGFVPGMLDASSFRTVAGPAQCSLWRQPCGKVSHKPAKPFRRVGCPSMAPLLCPIGPRMTPFLALSRFFFGYTPAGPPEPRRLPTHRQLGSH